MGMRLVNNTSRIVNINLPKYGINFILKQNESKPGLSNEYIDRLKDQIKDFGLSVVDDLDGEGDSFVDYVKKEVSETSTETQDEGSATVFETSTETQDEGTATVVETPNEIESEETATVVEPPKKRRSYRRRVKN